MMRFVAIAALIAAPATADEDTGYDAGLLTACLAEADGAAGIRACIGVGAAQCIGQPGGKTTAGMGACLSHELGQWEDDMAAWLAVIASDIEAADAGIKALDRADPALPAFEASQADWLAFRQSTCELVQAGYYGGTGAGPDGLRCWLELTAERVIWLETRFGSGGRD
ncbi:MAG: lysozyme inhibitor LprI family protein [Paracoccus sp. (in: a-proteobacteria)]|nr:lysozyme inhibitor LprI family protein [Paracoccus sp. (in: a-proteobacteria)]